jgi:hypothetical protein
MPLSLMPHSVASCTAARSGSYIVLNVLVNAQSMILPLICVPKSNLMTSFTSMMVLSPPLGSGTQVEVGKQTLKPRHQFSVSRFESRRFHVVGQLHSTCTAQPLGVQCAAMWFWLHPVGNAIPAYEQGRAGPLLCFSASRFNLNRQRR